MGARAVGPWVGEQKPLGKTSLRGNPQSRVDLPTYLNVLIFTANTAFESPS